MTWPRATVLLGLLAVVLGGLAIWWSLRKVPAEQDPRWHYPTVYRNVRPNIRYVGDEACAACHPDVVTAYAGHPMRVSLQPVARLLETERGSAATSFDREVYHYEVLRRSGQMIHRVSQRDGAGGFTHRLEAPVQYAVGSGTRGRTYLVDRQGYLFQSPISWFSTKAIWDLTPGFNPEEHFERPAQPKCLYCHTNSVEPVAHTINRYQAPLFRGHGIGCERCHGPGELHVAARERGDVVDGIDTTIVNPARLEPPLRDAVCAQCHLQGEVRIERRGRSLFEYRPGLPLELFVSTFARRPEWAEGLTVGGHVEQMESSSCFQKSQGQLGCISCHDPHTVPTAQTRVAHYRRRCLQCHTATSCTVPEARRRETSREDSCIQCHMPATGSRIAHTAIADHRIRRRPVAVPAEQPRPLREGEVPLVPLRLAEDLPEAERARDLGLALGEVGRNYPGIGPLVGPSALPLLEGATRADADDLAAWEARGFVLWQLNRRAEGLTALKAVLDRAPERELTLTYAAVLSAALGRRDEAIGYWRRAIAVNPWSALYHYRLAKLLAESKQWAAAQTECEAALRLNPFHPQTRELYGACQRHGKP